MATVPIREDFDNYTPPRWFRRTVERLLAPLDLGHTNGLAAIVLTNSARSDRRKGQRRRRRIRHHPGRTIGRYFPGSRGRQPWIELIVDCIIGDLPHLVQLIPLVQNLIVAHVLYHEVGHHLHGTVGSAARGDEPSAEVWRKKLTRLYFPQRQRFLLKVLRPVTRRIARWLRDRP
jgi:hypothetical protein